MSKYNKINGGVMQEKEIGELEKAKTEAQGKFDDLRVKQRELKVAQKALKRLGIGKISKERIIEIAMGTLIVVLGSMASIFGFNQNAPIQPDAKQVAIQEMGATIDDLEQSLIETKAVLGYVISAGGHARQTGGTILSGLNVTEEGVLGDMSGFKELLDICGGILG